MPYLYLNVLDLDEDDNHIRRIFSELEVCKRQSSEELPRGPGEANN